VRLALDYTILAIGIVVAASVAFVLGYFLRKHLAEAKIASAESEASKILEEAKKNAEGKVREAKLESQ
jgi:ribonuclease Y